MLVKPYGSWPSMVTPESITAGTVGLAAPAFDGDDLYWLESRPDEGGRVGLWRRVGAGALELVVPAPYNVRSRVHEYGGGEYAVRDGVLVFSSFADNHVYRVRDGEITAITDDEALRYADLRVHPDRGLVLAVREDHSGAGEPVNMIVALDLDGVGSGTALCSGADFYASPELSPAGRLAWTEWDHPDLPWDATRVRVGDLVDGVVRDVTEVAGGPGESVVHPQWSPDGALVYVSDRTGWWNLYEWRDGSVEAIRPEEDEYALPHWVFGRRPYDWLDAQQMVVTRHRAGIGSVAVIDRRSGAIETIVGSGVEGPLAVSGDRVAVVVADERRPARLTVLDLRSHEETDVREASPDPLPTDGVSVPQAVSWPSTVEDVPGEVHGWYYPPTNPTVVGPPDERPPLITLSHGGPTSAARRRYDLERQQYWTSRGFAVLDVNYRGSTGYGRAYRDALRGRWGVLDVADCAAGAVAMADQGLADPARLVVRGGSAGGYTTLRALTTTEVFTAGISSYGIGDLETLAHDTHKFEARYLDGLVGPYPAAQATYRERSPVHHLDRLSAPMLLLQGADDLVVPPSQSRSMSAAVRAKGLPVCLLVFDGEGHGFRRAESITAALEASLYFLGRVFGFTPADDLPALEIDNL